MLHSYLIWEILVVVFALLLVLYIVLKVDEMQKIRVKRNILVRDYLLDYG